MHEFLGDGVVDDLLDHRLREMQALRQLRQGFARLQAHEFQHEPEQHAARKPGFGNGARHHRRVFDHPVKLLGAHVAERDQILAQTATLLPLPLHGRFELGRAHEAPHEQDVA
jgi:hypothetical protein